MLQFKPVTVRWCLSWGRDKIVVFYYCLGCAAARTDATDCWQVFPVLLLGRAVAR